MKNFGILVWVVLILILAYSCEEKAATHLAPETWSEAQVRDQLELRRNKGDTLPVLPADLLAFCPDVWPPFERKEANSSGIYEKSAFLSQATTVYLQPEGGFLELYIADYAADQGAFLKLIRRFEKVKDDSDPLKKVWPEKERGVFAWEKLDRQSQLHYLEAGVYARFHILLRTNLPEGRQSLAQAWEKLDWNELRELNR